MLAQAGPAAATVLLLVLLAAFLRSVAGALAGRTSRRVALAVSALPLLFVAPGLLPGRTLAGTGILGEYVPWRTESFRAAVAQGGRTNPLLADVVTLYEPWRKGARDGIAFFPAQFAGTALLGNGHSAALFPLEVVGRVLPLPSASAFVQAGRLLLAAWGFFVLLRVLGLGPRGALAGALAFVGSGYLALWRAHVNASAVALAPWLVAAAIRLWRRPGPLPAVVLGLAGGGVVLAGHPQSVASIGLLAALSSLGSVGTIRRHGEAAARWFAGALALSALLAAPVALPFLQNLRASAAFSERSVQAAGPSRSVYPHLSSRVLLPSLHLLVFGEPRDGTWSGEGNLIEVGGGSVGTVPLALLPAAFAARRRRRLAALWLVLGLGGLLVAAGVPVIGRLWDLVPGGGLVQQHRLTLYWSFAASVLAGVAAENLARGRGRRALAAGAAGAGATLALLAATHPALRRPLVLALEPAVLLLSVVASCGLRPALGGAALAAGILLPRVAFFATWIPATPTSTYYPETPAIRHVRERASGYRVAGLEHALLPASAAFFGLEDVRGYEPMVLRRYLDYVSALGSTEDSVVPRLADARHPALRFLGVRYVFAGPDAAAPSGWAVAYRGEDAAVFEDPAALRRLFVPRRLERAADEDAAVRRALSIADAADVVVVAPGGAGPPEPNGPAEVRSLVVAEGRVEARVAGRGPFLVATSVPALPGWRLFVDGAAARPVSVNGAFLGARLPAGAHDVRFEYGPAGIPAGLGLGALGLLAAAGLAAAARPGPQGSPAPAGVSR